MTVTYRVVHIAPVSDTETKVVIQVEYMDKTRQFESLVGTGTKTQSQLCTEAWQLVKDKVQIFVSQVTNGTYLQGSTFVPQDDGSILFN